MPTRRKHEEFDIFLAEKDVLLSDGQYGEVHSFMDRGVIFYGAAHRKLDVYHREKGLRRWINGKFNVIGQDRATDWLRAGLGHICLDNTDSTLWRTYSWGAVFDSAYRSMAQKRWTKSRFVSS